MLSVAQIAHRTNTFFQSRPVQKAYVFGSYARGEATATSDIDILIDLDSSQLIGLIDYIKMLDELELLLEHKIDLVASDGLSRHIKPVIDQEKKLIYEAPLGRP